MKVAALGDAHLGRSYLPVTRNNVNVREQDFEESFERAVALALDQQPDLVVWLGDVFDHPRPSYRSFRVAQRALARIRDHGVPAVVIAGNHDTPRMPGAGSPYSVLADTFEPAVRFAHRMAYERVEVGDLVVHAVPQMMTPEALVEALDDVGRSLSLDRTNLLVTHPLLFSVKGKREYTDINELEVDEANLRADLVLLGHWHYHLQVAERIWYVGATDTFNFADNPEQPKGIVVLDTDTGTVRHLPIPDLRPLVTLPGVDALGLGPEEVTERMVAAAATVPAGAVARLFVNGIDPEVWRSIDLAAVHEAGRAALHLRTIPEFASVTNRWQPVELPSMGERWDDFVGKQDLVGFDRDRIRTLGRDYIDRAVQESG
jgi:DNA repair exonuclease SbcCD nuclease subunit